MPAYFIIQNFRNYITCENLIKEEKTLKKISTMLIVVVLMLEVCFALSGDSETIYKTSLSSVTSLSVMSPINNYSLYVSAYGDDGNNLTLKAYQSSGVNDSYTLVIGTTLTVDYGESQTKTVHIDEAFARIKLSGLGQGVGKITAK